MKQLHPDLGKVLDLVHDDCRVCLGTLSADFAREREQQVVEVDGPLLPERLLIFAEELPDGLR